MRPLRQSNALLAAVPVVAAVLTLLSTTPAASPAQAPVITPRGDPSVRNDTIYALAVRALDFPDEPYVYLLDDGVVRIEADGRGTRTFRQVVQILTQEGAEQWGEHTLAYAAGRETLTLNWMRVVGPGGQLVTKAPTHEQESLAPVDVDVPVYTDQRLRRLTLGGVAPGVIVDYSYTVETVAPVLRGDFFLSWSVSTPRPTRRSRLLVDVPAELAPRIAEHNLTVARATRESNGRRVYAWAAGEVLPAEHEPFAPDSAVGQRVNVASSLTWNDVAAWYAALARDRYRIDGTIEARLRDVLASARNGDDSLRAVHRWVAQDFRYVSLSLGAGGYQPRAPRDVFDTKYGDCKDKATLFIAIARRLGLRAHPVLLSSRGGVNRRLPSLHQFNHMIAAVERRGGYAFFDLTADLTPFGTLPPAQQGEFALIVHPDGRAEEVTLPADPAAANRSEARLVGELAPDGTFSGRYTELKTGVQQYGLRAAFASGFTGQQRERLARAIANGIFEGANGDSLSSFDGRDLRAEPRVSLVISRARAAASAGSDLDILTLPVRSYAMTAALGDLETRPPRRYPIAVEEVFGPREEVSELRLTLPPGWRARLPRAVAASSPFGSYSADYTQSGRELRVVRRLVGASGVEPPERLHALIMWLREIGKDDVRYIVLERAK